MFDAKTMLGLPTTCNTTGGPSDWNDQWKCQFPFQYNGKIFNECIDGENNGKWFSWCSTKVLGEDRVHVNGNWAYCSQECSCKTVGGPKDSWKIGDRCQFPFTYLGEEYNGCIEYGLKQNESVTNRKRSAWCSTEVHGHNRSHIHGHWGKCSLGCPIQASIRSSSSNETDLQMKKCGECRFPFVLETNGTKIYDCISVNENENLHNLGYWCPSQLDENMRPIKRKWKLCDKNCTSFNNSGNIFLSISSHESRMISLLKLIFFEIIEAL